MTYNLTQITQANTTLELITSIDVVTMGGMFGLLAVVVMGAIMVINLQAFQAREFFLFASFFVSIIAGFAWLAGIVTLFVAIVALLLNIIMMFLFWVTR